MKVATAVRDLATPEVGGALLRHQSFMTAHMQEPATPGVGGALLRHQSMHTPSAVPRLTGKTFATPREDQKGKMWPKLVHAHGNTQAMGLA